MLLNGRKDSINTSRITNVSKQIGYDIKRGATTEQVLLFLQKIRNNSFFLVFRTIMVLWKD
jgi:hypothetical protein